MKHNLKLFKNKKHRISEDFGMSDEMFEHLQKEIFIRVMAELLNNKNPKGRFTDDFIKAISDEKFDAKGWQPESPNDYFMLGFLFGAVMDKIHSFGHNPIADILKSLANDVQVETRVFRVDSEKEEKKTTDGDG